jgi:hypothetical protein
MFNSPERNKQIHRQSKFATASRDTLLHGGGSNVRPNVRIQLSKTIRTNPNRLKYQSKFVVTEWTCVKTNHHGCDVTQLCFIAEILDNFACRLESSSSVVIGVLELDSPQSFDNISLHSRARVLFGEYNIPQSTSRCES